MRSKYHEKRVRGVKVDVYRVLRIYNVTDPAIAHAVKKLLRSGRGHKDQDTDIAEAIASLQRWQEMRQEDKRPLKLAPRKAPTSPANAWSYERHGDELEETEGHAGAYL